MMWDVVRKGDQFPGTNVLVQTFDGSNPGLNVGSSNRQTQMSTCGKQVMDKIMLVLLNADVP
jgi:hypothetical protein